MTKREYELIAAAIARASRDIHDNQLLGVKLTPSDAVACVARTLAASLARDNGRFDSARFLTACQPK